MVEYFAIKQVISTSPQPLIINLDFVYKKTFFSHPNSSKTRTQFFKFSKNKKNYFRKNILKGVKKLSNDLSHRRHF